MKDALPHVLSHLVRAGQQRGRSAEGEVSSGDQRGRSPADEQRGRSPAGIRGRGQQRGSEGEVSSGDQRGRSAADEQRAASRGGRAHLADGVLDGRLEFVSQLWVGSVVEGAEGEVPASKRARGVDGRLSRRCKECASRRCKEGKRVWSPQGGEACMVAARRGSVYGRHKGGQACLVAASPKERLGGCKASEFALGMAPCQGGRADCFLEVTDCFLIAFWR